MPTHKKFCTLCHSEGVSESTCPYNYNSKYPNIKTHYNVLKGGSLLKKKMKI